MIGFFTVLLPSELLDEFYRTITTKPYLVDRIDPRQALAFIGTMRDVATLLTPLSQPAPPVVRDPNDDSLLAHALAAQADYLVTGDADLLALGNEVAPLRILSPADFVRLLD